MVTGSPTDELAEQVLLAGAQDFLVKGTFSGAALQRLLRFTLARHRHTLELFTSMAHSGDDDQLTRLESLGAAGVGVASRSLGRVTLAETYPEAFAAAVAEYSQLVPSRLEERGLHVDYQVSSRTRAVAWDIGHLRATPRDVVDVHLAAVRALTAGKSRPRANALFRSGESLLTETLGHLAAFYRAQALGRPPVSRRRAPADRATGGPGVKAKFRLFVAGETARSLRAAAHIRTLCAEVLDDDYELEIIDVLERPDLADEARILATPTVIKASPPPLRRVIGDLSDLQRLASALDLELPEPPIRGVRP